MTSDLWVAPLARRVIARTHCSTEPRILSSGTASVKNLRQLVRHQRREIRPQLTCLDPELAKIVDR